MTISKLVNFGTSALESVKAYVPNTKTLITGAAAATALAGTAYYFLSASNSIKINFETVEPHACTPHSFLGLFDTPFLECFPIRKLENFLPISNTVESIYRNTFTTLNTTASLAKEQAATNLTVLGTTVATLAQKGAETFNTTAKTCFNNPISSSLQSIANTTTSLLHKGIEILTPIATTIAQQFGTNSESQAKISPSTPLIPPSDLTEAVTGTTPYIAGAFIATACILIPLATAYFLRKPSSKTNPESRELVLKETPQDQKLEAKLTELLRKATPEQIYDATVHKLTSYSLSNRISIDPLFLPTARPVFLPPEAPKKPLAITHVREPSKVTLLSSTRNNHPDINLESTPKKKKRAGRPTKPVETNEAAETQIPHRPRFDQSQFVTTFLFLQAFMATNAQNDSKQILQAPSAKKKTHQITTTQQIRSRTNQPRNQPRIQQFSRGSKRF